MTHAARHAAIAALTALVALAAIIAADLTPPASAQGEESGGRIVARLLDDGRVEFGWQPTGGSRVLPRQRYFPASIDHQRWLRSSPVEVDGAAIGRINARQLDDGRIEFAFTPTDRERITPQARYFPANARVGRWLRSTEIAIGPPAAGYSAISAATYHTCAIRDTGEIACWGARLSAVTDAPDGSFTTISSAGLSHCAIRTNGEITCWGTDSRGETDAPDGRFTAVSMGDWHTCAIRDTEEIACWGSNETSYLDETDERVWVYAGQASPPTGSYTAVAAGQSHTCAIRTSGEIDCWGNNIWYGQTAAPEEGSYTAVSTGFAHSCAIRESGEITCWGGSSATGETDAPDGRYTAIDAGGTYTCAIRESGEIDCWGYDLYGETNAPDGSYTAVSAGGAHTCAIRAGDGAIECWGGLNQHGQATPPTD